jgi:phosphoglycolate phosphatase-like HAD superfamily hydrolase
VTPLGMRQTHMRNAGVIFDVDGTLVDSTEFEDRLYAAAVLEILGRVSIRSNWGEYEHVTDAGILRQICHENDLDVSKCEHLVRARFGELVSEYLRQQGPCRPLPGALRLFEELRSIPVRVGIATGGWGHTARMNFSMRGSTYRVFRLLHPMMTTNAFGSWSAAAR